MKRNILIVEDEHEIVHLIKNRLDSNEYEVTTAHDGHEAIEYIRSQHFDLVTLDIMLPSFNGYDVCKELRKRTIDTLVIMISSLETEEHKLKGYEVGVDDYIAKPFSPKELAAKINSLLKRRFELQHSHTHKIRNVVKDEERKKIFCATKELKLTPSEFTIFSILLNTPKKVFSREELAQSIYDHDLGSIDNRGIDTHIYQIRKKIAHNTQEKIIKTVRGMGYKIDEA